MIGIKRCVNDGQVECPKVGRKARWHDCRPCYDGINVVWKGGTEAPDHVLCARKDDGPTTNSVADEHK